MSNNSVTELIIVRPLQKEETESALRLAWQVFTEYESPDYTPEGTAEFKKTLNDKKIPYRNPVLRCV